VSKNNTTKYSSYFNASDDHPMFYNDINEIPVDPKGQDRIETGWPLFNKFICRKSKGLKYNFTCFLTALQGFGKTTFLLTLANKLSGQGMNVLYNSTEQQPEDLKDQMSDYKLTNKIGVSRYQIVENLFEHCEKKYLYPGAPQFCIMVDSISSIDGLEERNKVRIFKALNGWAKANKVILFVIGTVTKNGSAAGSNELAHIPDAHIELNYSDNKETKDQKILRAKKNRFGKTDIEFAYEIQTDKGFVFLEEENETEEAKEFQELQNEISSKANKLIDEQTHQWEKQYGKKVDDKIFLSWFDM